MAIILLFHIKTLLTSTKMRDKRFVAEHRGGPLKKEQQYQLIKWACASVKHVLHLTDKKIDERIKNAMQTAKDWEQGKASAGDARKASVAAHAAARESSDTASIAIARAAGHAVATAHMADHSLGGALYALKAVQSAGKSIDVEKKWQIKQLPPEIKDFVLSAMSVKEKSFKLK